MLRLPTAAVALLALAQGCALTQVQAAANVPTASIAVWTVPKAISAGKEFWVQTRIVPNVTMQKARVSVQASPADFRIVGPASFELGTITPPEMPPPSKPPALPFSYVNAFHLVALHSGVSVVGVVLTSSAENVSVSQEIEVAP